MNRNENDLRAALRELEQRADRHGAPSTASILATMTDARPASAPQSRTRRFPRWVPPVAAAALVAGTAVTAVMLGTSSGSSSSTALPPAGGRTTAAHPALPHHATSQPATRTATSATTPSDDAAGILDAAATKLDAQSGWSTPDPQDFFYVRTTDATTWTSVSGTRAGDGRTADGTPIAVPGCANGHLVGNGEAGDCTLDDVPHYLADAPTQPAAWDAYLEGMAPEAKAAGAQGKIIVEVLHQDLVAPHAAAALLRYTATCPGLHTLPVAPIAGENLIGVTCTSMTNGSYGLVFDATSHAPVGFVTVTGSGQADGAAEIVQQTGIVPAVGRTP